MRPYVATFFRAKWLYLLTLLILVSGSLIGAYFLTAGQYQATARIWVDKPLLVDVLDEASRPDYGPPPAEQRGDMLYQLLQTDSFMTSVIKDTVASSRLTGVPDQDRKVIGKIRENLTYEVLGSHTVMITYTGRDPVLCQQMVQGTIDQFRAWMFESRLEQSSAQMEFYRKQIDIYRRQMSDSQQRLEDFKTQHPKPAPASPVYLELTRLQREYETARGLYTDAVTRIGQADVIENLSNQGGQTEFRALDKPSVPQLPYFPLKKMLRYLVLGFAASFGFVFAVIMLVTWQDRLIRTSDDLARLSDIPVLMELPHYKSQSRKRLRQYWRRGGLRTTSPRTLDASAAK